MFSTVDVLGTLRPVTHFYGDGSYDCPHCHNAIRADEGFGPCRNPWCIANPQMPVESAKQLITKREVEEKERADRERNHKWAMERIARDNAERIEQYNQWRKIAREHGICFTCLHKRDKRVKHRTGRDC